MNSHAKPVDVQVHRLRFITRDDLTIPTFSLLKEDGTPWPKAELPEIEQATALRIYHTFVRIRALDERMLAAQRQGRISFYMTESGEEATDIASTAAMAEDDMIFAQYREQGAIAYRGYSLDNFMNQLFSNAEDLGKGRQMPIHYGAADLHYMTISSPLATQIPQATGYAYGIKARGGNNCVLCFFGEGAASEGDFHAALNMAGVLRVPVIFFCRNNRYAISTPVSEQCAGDGIAPRGLSYGLHTIRVDGNDALAIFKATQAARKMAVEKQQPVLIEAMTYRLGAHSSSDDPRGYRSKEEEEHWRSKDPVNRYRQWLLNQGWLTEAEDAELRETEKKAILSAMKAAEKRPCVTLDTLVTDVYEAVPWHLQEQLDQLTAHVANYPEHYPIAGKAISEPAGGSRHE
ncbi:thiamine pyrophosphate-dependent dehydrogenase E1 component subunit alpha [Pokkaliibacter sp. CJK22405]|uniref:thiamine pyrophosphate-dependent dehydrogenase E1 component subunit alpha n=1 Tax=Pokkaliibacter sp. CJK22405 TaxID=3384615 RepID=UPI003984BE97